MSRINTDLFLWPSEQSVVSSFMSDYKEVDGVMMAHAIETRTGGSPIAQIVINKVETNVEIEDSLFKMPKKEGGPKEK